MSNLIELGQSDIVNLQNYLAGKSFADGYIYLKAIVDARIPNEFDPIKAKDLATLSEWLNNAAQINANDGSFKSEFVRGATEAVAESVGKTITDQQFQDVSNRLAEKVIQDAIAAGGIASAKDIIDKDVNAAVSSDGSGLGLPTWAWAGTLGDLLPITFGRLGQDFNSVTGNGVADYLRNLGYAVDANFAGLGRAAYKAIVDTLIRPAYGSDFNSTIPTSFAAASIYVTPVRRDPLVLDLDSDGIETLPINTTTPVMFDLDNTGVKKSVGWIKSDDGFLVLDRNANGTIDSGAELFGDATPLSGGGTAADGFAALAQFDTNLDGQMTAADSAFANLRVWRDLNQNGLSEAGELSTLTSLNITAINVAASSHTITVSNGNLITDQGSYTRGDGTVGTAGEIANSADVQLATDPFHTTFTTPLSLTAQALTLPDMNGSGQVRSLREAISSNSALAILVTQFTQATTSADRRALLDNMLKEWSNTSTMGTTFTGAYAGHTLTVDIQGTTSGTAEYQAWVDKLTILEHFNGRTFNTVPTGTAPVTVTLLTGAQPLLQQSYDAIKDSVYGALVVQAQLKPYLDQTQLNIDATGVKLDLTATGVAIDFTALENSLRSTATTNAVTAMGDLIDLRKYAETMLAANDAVFEMRRVG